MNLLSKYFLPAIYTVLLCFVVLSCKKHDEEAAISDYKFFNVQQQGWKSKRVTQFVNDINYTATEVPIPYYFLKQHPNDYDKVDSLYTIYQNERVIEVEFQHSNSVDLLLDKYTNRPYDDAVKYLAFTIKKDFTVVTSSKDTIACSGVTFERNFKVAPFKRALLYFTNIKPEDKLTLIYQDQLFGNGILKFNLEETPLTL